MKVSETNAKVIRCVEALLEELRDGRRGVTYMIQGDSYLFIESFRGLSLGEHDAIVEEHARDG